MRTPDTDRLLAEVARAFKRLGVPWYVFGAQAVIAAGVARATADIDITAQTSDTRSLLSALRRAGFELADFAAADDTFVARTRVLPLRHRESGFGLDVALAIPGFDDELFERVIVRKVGKVAIPFVDTNDLIVLKLLAARAKDLEDVAALLRTGSAELDPKVVRLRLKQLGDLVGDSTMVPAFERLLAENWRLPPSGTRRGRKTPAR